MSPNELVPIARAVEAAETRAAGRLDATALQPNIGALMHDVARLMRRRFERRARQSGLSITRQQARALLSVARNEGLSQAAVATLLDIEPIALVRLLDRLHEEGLVERRLHPTDRRVRTLWMTPLGWTVVDRILAINAQIREEACAGLSPAARDALLQTLDHLKSNLLMDEESEPAAAE
ncbi:MAG TPA: MarR family transcriptional regulator [Stellaceae bacterium]|jgi:DNA-binding MarR family transcriptional regulator